MLADLGAKFNSTLQIFIETHVKTRHRTMITPLGPTHISKQATLVWQLLGLIVVLFGVMFWSRRDRKSKGFQMFCHLTTKCCNKPYIFPHNPDFAQKMCHNAGGIFTVAGWVSVKYPGRHFTWVTLWIWSALGRVSTVWLDQLIFSEEQRGNKLCKLVQNGLIRKKKR